MLFIHLRISRSNCPPLLQIELPLDAQCYGHSSSSSPGHSSILLVDLIRLRTTRRLPIHGHHTRTFWPQWTSVFRATWPTRCHFNDNILTVDLNCSYANILVKYYMLLITSPSMSEDIKKNNKLPVKNVPRELSG